MCVNVEKEKIIIQIMSNPSQVMTNEVPPLGPGHHPQQPMMNDSTKHSNSSGSKHCAHGKLWNDSQDVQ